MEEHNSTEGKTLQVYCLVKGNVLRQRTAANASVFKVRTDVCPCNCTEGLHEHHVFKIVCAENEPWEKTPSLH